MDEYEDSGCQNPYDWNICILRAVVRLLEHLRLQPLDGFPGDDIPHAVSRRFIQYQGTLLDALSFDYENVSQTYHINKVVSYWSEEFTRRRRQGITVVTHH